VIVERRDCQSADGVSGPMNALGAMRSPSHLSVQIARTISSSSGRGISSAKLAPQRFSPR
jgi:hypothetical protein